MTFDKLHSETNCICLDDLCKQDIHSVFGIKTNKKELRDADFKSQFQKALDNNHPLEITECSEICSYKGISCSIITTENKDRVFAIYKALFPISPGYRPYIKMIKWNENSGMIKESPDSVNPFHHDFYACDHFTVNSVELIDTISMAENV